MTPSSSPLQPSLRFWRTGMFISLRLFLVSMGGFIIIVLTRALGLEATLTRILIMVGPLLVGTLLAGARPPFAAADLPQVIKDEILAVWIAVIGLLFLFLKAEEGAANAFGVELALIAFILPWIGTVRVLMRIRWEALLRHLLKLSFRR